MFKIPLTDVGQLALWAWKNREQLKGVPRDAGEFVETHLSEKGDGVQRTGSTLRRRAADGSSQTLAFLGQTAHQLADIEKAISGGVDAGQQVLSAASLQSLQSVSMVTLGLSAITPLILAAQFAYLRKRFNELQKDIRHLEQLLEDRYVSELESGLELLESGARQQNKSRIEGALQKCNDAAVFFANRVQNAIGEQQDRRGILLLSRHLAVAVCGTTRCFVALEEDAEARKTLGARRSALRAAAKAVFQQTVAKDPERFLVPELSGDVSLASLVALFQQANDAGALDKGDPLQEAVASQPSASQFFETMRGRLFKIKWGGLFKPKPKALKDELRDATACVEETNRVLSLAEFLDESDRAGKKAIEGVFWFDKEAKAGPSPFFAWGY
jgi:hypothetical protein